MLKIAKRLHYTPIDIGFLLFFITLLFFANCQIRFQSSRRILNSLNRNRAPLKAKHARSGGLPPHRLFQLLEIADRRMHRTPSCVRQALVLSWLFRWFKIDTRVQIGVRLRGNELEAHTWLEYQGVPLQSAPPSAYQPLSKLGDP